MKFSAVFAALALAGAVAAQSTTTDAPATNTQTASYGKETMDCLKACDDGDVICQARCLNNPHPNEQMANDTTKCVGECEQGNGTEEETAKYAACINKCIDTHFFTRVPAGSQPTGGASNGGSDGGSNNGGSSDDKDAEGEDKKDGEEDNKDSAAGANSVIISFVGAAAIVAAAFAL